MKKIFNLFSISLLLLPFFFTACNQDDEPIKEIKVVTLEVEGIQDNIINLFVGDTHTVSVKLTPEEAVDKDEYTYKYYSTDESIFIVDEQGNITALKHGEAALRIDAVNNTDLWTACTISVEDKEFPVEDIELIEEYTMGVGQNFDLASSVVVKPLYATNKSVIYISGNETVATVDEKGQVSALELGEAIITVKSVDGSNVQKQCKISVKNISGYTFLDRTGWTVTTSHPYCPDATAGGKPEYLIDPMKPYEELASNEKLTCLVLVKPGKSREGITVPKNDVVYFTIDMQQEQTFNSFTLLHRLDQKSINLRVTKVSVYGSNDNENFTKLGDNIMIAGDIDIVNVSLPMTATYRYFRMTYDAWNSGGDTMQTADFNIGSAVFED